MRRFFLDANILIYTRDYRDSAKQRVAAKWLQTLANHELAVVNLQVLNEVRHVALRKLTHLAAEDVKRWTEDLRSLGDAVIDEDVVEEAWAVQANYRLSWFDCLLVGSAERLGCSYFVTEDMGADRRIGSMTLINPFKHDIDDVLKAS